MNHDAPREVDEAELFEKTSTPHHPCKGAVHRQHPAGAQRDAGEEAHAANVGADDKARHDGCICGLEDSVQGCWNAWPRQRQRCERVHILQQRSIESAQNRSSSLAVDERVADGKPQQRQGTRNRSAGCERVHHVA